MTGRSFTVGDVRGEWPNSFGYERVGSFATSGPPTSINTAGGHTRGVSSYECFPREVVGKYWHSSGCLGDSGGVTNFVGNF